MKSSNPLDLPPYSAPSPPPPPSPPTPPSPSPPGSPLIPREPTYLAPTPTRKREAEAEAARDDDDREANRGTKAETALAPIDSEDAERIDIIIRAVKADGDILMTLFFAPSLFSLLSSLFTLSLLYLFSISSLPRPSLFV